MSNHFKAVCSVSLLIILSSTLAGCTSETEPLGEDEIGELSVVLTLDFVDQGNQTTNLADRLTNGSITFDPILVAHNVSAYRVMEALQLEKNSPLMSLIMLGWAPLFIQLMASLEPMIGRHIGAFFMTERSPKWGHQAT